MQNWLLGSVADFPDPWQGLGQASCPFSTPDTLCREVQLTHTHSAWLCKEIIHPSVYCPGQSLFLLKILADFATAAMMCLGKQHFTWPFILVCWSKNCKYQEFTQQKNSPSLMSAGIGEDWRERCFLSLMFSALILLCRDHAGMSRSTSSGHQPHN